MLVLRLTEVLHIFFSKQDFQRSLLIDTFQSLVRNLRRLVLQLIIFDFSREDF